MWTILFFMIVAGTIHVILPNHWMEAPVLARGYSMPFKKSILFFVSTALVHNLSTLIFALLVSAASILLNEQIEYFSIISALILIGIGVYYIFSKDPSHNHSSLENSQKVVSKKEFKRTYLLILTGLFFSPCIDVAFALISAGEQLTLYMLLFIAGLYFLISIISMSSLMSLAYLGVLKMRFYFIQKYFRKIMGVLFILLVFSKYLHPYANQIIDKVISETSINYDDRVEK